MPLSTRINEAVVRVRYAETDAAGIAHHAAYLPWLEVGRIEWLRAAGVSYRELEAGGFSLPVVEVRLRYVAPAQFDDLLVIRTGLADLRSRSVLFVYEVLTAEPNPRQLANATTSHICLRNGAVTRLPDTLRELAE